MFDMLCCVERIAQKRGDAVSKEVMKKVADDKKMSKQEKEERSTSTFTYLHSSSS